MMWVAWRNYRLVMIFGMVLLAGVAAFIIATGLHQLALFNDLGLAATGNAVSEQRNKFLDSYVDLDNIVVYFAFIPIFWGVLMAIPIIMELEQRTYRLSWTQSISRRRWLWTMLGIAILGSLVFSGILAALLSWWYAPRMQFQDPFGPMFYRGGVLPMVHTIFTLTLALIIGMFMRKSAIALLVAVVISIMVILGSGGNVRAHYIPPVQNMAPTTRALEFPEVPERSWIIEFYLVDNTGNRLSVDQVNEINAGIAKGDIEIENRIISQGVRYLVLFQPADRFWLFQIIEISLFLIVSLLLVSFIHWGIVWRMK